MELLGKHAIKLPYLSAYDVYDTSQVGHFYKDELGRLKILTKVNGKLMLMLTYMPKDPNDFTDMYQVLKTYKGWLHREALRRVYLNEEYFEDEVRDSLYSWESEYLTDYMVVHENEVLDVLDWVYDTTEVRYTLRLLNTPTSSLHISGADAVGSCTLVRYGGFFGPANWTEFTFVKQNKRREVSASVFFHEYAHQLNYIHFRSLDHGPTFLSIYGLLLERSGLMRNALKSMREWGLPTANLSA